MGCPLDVLLSETVTTEVTIFVVLGGWDEATAVEVATKEVAVGVLDDGAELDGTTLLVGGCEEEGMPEDVVVAIDT